MIIALLVACPAARADGSPPPRRVALALPATDDARAAELARTVGAQLSDLEVELDVVRDAGGPRTAEEQLARYRRLAADRQAVAACWSVTLPDGELVLFISDAGGGHLLVRRVAPEDGGGQLEAAALIVRGAVETLLAGGTIGVAAPPPGPAAPPPAAAAAKVGLTVSYAFSVRSAARPANHGIGAELLVAPWSLVSIFAGYTWWWPDTVAGERATITVRHHPLHLGAGLELPLGLDWRVGPRLGLVFDYATQTTAGDAPAAPRTNQDLVVAAFPALAVGWNPVAGLWLRLTLGGALAINPVHYVDESAAGTETLERPFRFAPEVTLGLGYAGG